MARYIDLDEAIRTAIKACVNFVGHGITQVDAVNIALDIEQIPTAENVAEVVFCQDCKYAQRVSDEYGNLDFHCRKMNDYMSPVDFCSRGERKEKI